MPDPRLSDSRSGFGFLAKVHARLFRQRPEMDVISILLLAAVCALAGFGLMLSHAVQTAFERSGSSDTALVLAKGSKSEAESFITPQSAGQLRGALSAAGLAGLPLDQQMVISTSVERDGKTQFLSLRGIDLAGPSAGARRIVEGRMVKPGVNEVVVGRPVLRMFPSLRVGNDIVLARKPWRIVGLFEMNGDVRENEVVGEIRQVQTRYGAGDLINSIRIPATGEKLEAVTRELGAANGLDLSAEPENEFFARQAKPVVSSVRRLQILIMALVVPAALLGLLSLQRIHVGTMLGELRLLSFLGFQSRDIMISLLLRSVLLGIVAALATALALSLGLAGRSVEFDMGLQTVSLRYVAGPGVYLGMLLIALGITILAGFLSGAERRLVR